MTQAWTDNQLAAITTLDGDVCVSAGAGSGKTGVLVERFVRIVQESAEGKLLADKAARVGEILVFTFTDKATREMKERIVESLSRMGLQEERRQVESAYISTIHGFCSRMLKENPFEAGVDPQFTVLDEAEARRLLRGAFEDTLERAFADGDVDIVELAAAAQNERLFGTDVRDPLGALDSAVACALARLRGAGWRAEELEELLEQGVEGVSNRGAKLVVEWIGPACASLLHAGECL